MKVIVKFLATIRQITGEPLIEFELRPGNNTVWETMRNLEFRYGPEFKEATAGSYPGGIPKIRVLVNGRDIDFLDGTGTELKEGDVLVLVPPVAGG